MDIRDRLTDAERRDLDAARARDAAIRPTAAQHKSIAYAQDAIHTALGTLDSKTAADAVLAALSGRCGMASFDLERLGHALCRLAWDMERNRGGP